MILGVQPAGGVDDDLLHFAGTPGLQRVENHSGRIAARLLAHHVDAEAFAPEGDLVDGGGPEGIARGDQNPFAALLVKTRQLGDAGGFADAIDPHDQDHPGLARGPLDGTVDRFEPGGHFVGQDFADPFGVPHLVLADAQLELLDQVERGLHPEIGGDQGFFEVLQRFFIEHAATGDGGVHPVDDLGMGHEEAAFQLAPEALFFFRVREFGFRCRPQHGLFRIGFVIHGPWSSGENFANDLIARRAQAAQGTGDDRRPPLQEGEIIPVGEGCREEVDLLAFDVQQLDRADHPGFTQDLELTQVDAEVGPADFHLEGGVFGAREVDGFPGFVEEEDGDGAFVGGHQIG